MPVVKEIAYKHCALEVPPAGYDIVGENLIEAIKAVVGLEDDHPIIQTWKKAYQEIADVFIQVEKISMLVCFGKVSNLEIEKSNNYLQISKLSQLNLLTMI